MGPAPQQPTAFAQVFFYPSVADQDIWTCGGAAGIPAATITTLQLQGQLSYLTYNNAGLVQTLQTRLGNSTDPAALADADFHHHTTCTNAINALAANTPGGVHSDDLRRQCASEAYAADTARKVSASRPGSWRGWPPPARRAARQHRPAVGTCRWPTPPATSSAGRP